MIIKKGLRGRNSGKVHKMDREKDQRINNEDRRKSTLS
jgi:hypothetical protein